MSNAEGSSSHQVLINKERSLSMDSATQSILVQVQTLDDNVNYSPIYYVPDILREVSPRSFIPRVVSIGPLHHGLPNLKSVERKKPTALKELLMPKVTESTQEISGEQETLELEQTLDTCMKKVRESIPEIKTSYSGMKEDITDDELVQMMVRDGCYILQFIDKLPRTGNSFSDNRLRSRNIALDLVLLENQIPFFVLQDLYDLTLGKLPQESTDLIDMLMVLLDLINPFTEPLIWVKPVGEEKPTNILDLLHKLYKPNFTLPEIKEIPTAHSAVELDKVGVKVKPNRNPIWPMAMEFQYSFHSYNSTLRMPIVHIDNFFEVVLRNLIAYEQYSPVENYVTSYAMAMHMLAATRADIAMMQNSGVIISHLGSNEKASDMISSICKNVNLQDFYYTESWKKANNHYIGYWSKYIGVLKKKYLSTPWKAIALVAGIIVFALTIAQFVLRIITFAEIH